MARDKKPKKRKYADPKTGLFRHSDGDRRHRDAMKRAVRDMKVLRKLEEPPQT